MTTDQISHKNENWPDLADCTLCPRECHIDRNAGNIGYCGQTARLMAARAARHFWEEPCLSGTNGSAENIRLMAFLKRMDLAYACADIVVARAGAGTISELCLLEKAAVLIPSPNVAEDHQTKNAMALVDKNAAVMLKDAEAEERFGQVLEELLQDEARCAGLRKNIAALALPDSDEKIAREILDVING